MKINDKNEELIINFGAFNYNARKIASVLGLEELEVENELKNTNSELNRLLQKGKDMADYVIDLKLFELAKNGDIKALDKLNARKRLYK